MVVDYDGDTQDADKIKNEDSMLTFWRFTGFPRFLLGHAYCLIDIVDFYDLLFEF